MKKKRLAFALLVATLAMVAMAGDAGMGRFIGVWSVDYERTIEEARKSPKVSPEEIERMPAIIERMMASMSIEVNDAELVYVVGPRRSALPYTVKEVAGPTTTVVVSVKEQQAEMRFTVVAGDRMMFKSSQTDDMDFYVWKRTE